MRVQFVLRRTWFWVKRGVLVFCELLSVCEDGEEFSSGAIFECEIEFFLILEGFFEFDEEGVVDFGQYLFFHHDLFLLIFGGDEVLFKYFDCV